MRLQTVPARQGVVWVRQGFRAFFRQPLAFAGLFATFLFAVFVCALIPMVGTFVAVGLLPLVSVGFMIATRTAIAGMYPTPRVFIDPLRGQRERRIAMIKLGIAYAVATLAIMWISDILDGGAFEDMMDALPNGQTSPEAAAVKMAADPRIELGLLLRFTLAALLSVPFWHAPALVHWDGHGWAKALFSSTIACWRNKGAFTVYGLAWFGVIMLIGIAANLVFALLGMLQAMAVALVPISLMLSTIFYASLYFTFADCFVENGSPSVSLPSPTI
jgi:hypothetical protein